MRGWMGKIKATLLLGFIAILLSACGKENLTALSPKGYGAESSMDIIILTTLVMLGVFVVVMVIYTIVLIRFRHKEGDNEIPEQVEGSKTLETVWTVIPIILVFIMGIPTVIYTFDLADTSEASSSINIDVTGNQYWWHFEYADEEVVTSQDLYIPTGEKVFLNMLSSDVIHSFWVPTISGKMDVNPENVNTMFIEAYEEGVYWGKCAELCGPSHSLMDFKVIAVSPEKYEQWISDMQSVDPEEVPADAVAADGQELFQNNCAMCHAIGSSPAAIGPNLTNFGDRTHFAGYLEPSKEKLVEWIMDPESLKPGNLMTDMYTVTEDEADKIAEYLMQLQPSDITPESAGGLID
ncbi:cytochrome c oxidase subunit II [Oceanobacillus sp. CAU 1775]